MEPAFASEDFLFCSLGGGGRYFSVPSLQWVADHDGFSSKSGSGSKVGKLHGS